MKKWIHNKKTTSDCNRPRSLRAEALSVAKGQGSNLVPLSQVASPGLLRSDKEKAASKGMTLVELMVATAIVGLIVAVTLALLLQFVVGPGRSSASATALNNINSAAYWISRDGQMAQITDPVLVDGAAPVNIPGDEDDMTLIWIDRYESANIEHSSRYFISDGELMRDYDGSTSTVARGISNLGFSISGRTITVNITYSETETSETKIYEIHMRPVG